jgi:hypothetical protein
MDDEITIECDVCGRGFYGLGIRLIVKRDGCQFVCADCERKLTRTSNDNRVASLAAAIRRGEKRTARIGGV